MPAVVPVVNYEPPSFGGPPILPSEKRFRAEPTAPQPAPATESGPDNRAAIQTATAFADAALRRILEVIDRRRPLAHLRPLLAAGLADSLLAGPAREPGTGGAAQLRRVLAQVNSASGTDAEVAASYIRGGRLHAIACRIERVATATGPRWQVVALHLG
jgi:hypothetical protein